MIQLKTHKMAEVLDEVTTVVEQTLTPLGLMSGDNAIPKRMFAGALLGGAVITWIKPRWAFTDDGRPKPWSFLEHPGQTCGTEPTSTPWILGPVIGAFVMGVLI